MCKYFGQFKLQGYDPFDFGDEKLATIRIVVPRSSITDQPGEDIKMALASHDVEPPIKDAEPEEDTKVESSEEEVEEEILTDSNSEEEETSEIETPPMSDDDFNELFNSGVDTHAPVSVESPTDDVEISKNDLIAIQTKAPNEKINLGLYDGETLPPKAIEMGFSKKSIDKILDGKQYNHKNHTFEVIPHVG